MSEREEVILDQDRSDDINLNDEVDTSHFEGCLYSSNWYISGP
jgi:hypothetical protein